MAAGRATWSGHVRVSLVSFAVKIFTASNPSRQIALHQIHKPSGQRIRYQKVVPELGPVDTDEIVKGYEYRKGEYVTLEPDEIAKVRLESKHTIDVVQFVDLHEIDPIYYDKPYFIVPDDPRRGRSFCGRARSAETHQDGRAGRSRASRERGISSPFARAAKA